VTAKFFRLTVVLEVLLLVFTGCAFVYYSLQSADAEYAAKFFRARNPNFSTQCANSTIPVSGWLDPTCEQQARDMSSAFDNDRYARWNKNDAEGVLIVGVASATLLFAVFFTLRWIFTGRVRPWIPLTETPGLPRAKRRGKRSVT
jgi:hypothetical protein